MSILNYIERIKRENEGPRITAQEPRNMYQDGQLVQNTVDGSRPGYSGKKKPIKDYPLEVQKRIKDFGIEEYYKLPNHQRFNVRRDIDVGSGSGMKPKYDRPKYTKKVLEELADGLPKGVHLDIISGNERFVGTLTGPDGKKVTKSLAATEANKKIMLDWADTTKTKLYPNRLKDEEFKKLRLKNKKMSNQEFADFLNKKNKTTDLGYGFDHGSVSKRNLRLFPDEQFGPYVFRTVDEAKAIINQYPDKKFFFRTNPTDAEITRYASDLLAADKQFGKSGKRFKANSKNFYFNANAVDKLHPYHKSFDNFRRTSGASVEQVKQLINLING